MTELVTRFISENEYVIIAALWFLGEIIKTTKVVNSRWIPFILLVVSLILTPAIIGGYNAYNIVIAVIVAGMSVFADQLLKQGDELVHEYLEEE